MTLIFGQFTLDGYGAIEYFDSDPDTGGARYRFTLRVEQA